MHQLKASRETARAARLQIGQAIDLVHNEPDCETLRECLLKLLRDANSFVCAAEAQLPSATEKREPAPAA